MILYTKPGCPYCELVLEYAKEHDITLEERNILDDAVREELVNRGGKQQVPYFVDEENDIELYESNDIINYLERKKA